ncbi:3-methylornithyl-N6-L-lysine dehydrogenase PylD [uncultured Ruminococcus sp.]|uniref:3-methylornithyl-N6-L-lysine dehydrogenase PylD n=1 Tax=uncultured Ruminococcus sp. TaxID=165186 RepID=UPI00260FBDB3|nr:3-methylornithyl-N6-L-lysine dehydrogenase PylD [uncultured Ruminococcus sp.]
MSRLIPTDISHIPTSMQAYDATFQKQTGMTMAQTACHGLHISEHSPVKKTAVIPVTSGLGVISRFSESVCAILQHIGADAFVTEKTDVAGLQEAYAAGAEVIFLADDDVYAAFSTGGAWQSDNGFATGIAFAAALDGAVSCAGKKVLVLGAGPVGSAAAKWLDNAGAQVAVYDPLLGKAKAAAEKCVHATVLCDTPDLRQYGYILDATPNGGWISAEDVTEGTVFSVPGMPLSLTSEAAEKVTLIHNPLELGTIAMYYDCIRQMEG